MRKRQHGVGVFFIKGNALTFYAAHNCPHMFNRAREAEIAHCMLLHATSRQSDPPTLVPFIGCCGVETVARIYANMIRRPETFLSLHAQLGLLDPQ